MPKLTEFKFFKILNLRKIDFELVCGYLDSYYSERIIPKLDSEGNFRYSKGKKLERIIHPSNGKLKIIQKQIEKKFLKKIVLPYYVQGGVKKRSNVTNAKIHRGSKYKFLTDIKSFFPSINNDLVFKAFIQQGFSKDVSSHLTKLTTYKGMLPQGAPTSTSVANLVFRPIDEKLQKICQANKIKYSRYVDDLTFSSNRDFQPIVNELVSIINNPKFNFRISHAKTFYRCSICNITGVMTGVQHFGPTKELLEKMNNEKLTENQLDGYNRYIEYIEKVKVL